MFFISILADNCCSTRRSRSEAALSTAGFFRGGEAHSVLGDGFSAGGSAVHRWGGDTSAFVPAPVQVALTARG